MKLQKREIILIVVALLCIIITLGFFLFKEGKERSAIIINGLLYSDIKNIENLELNYDYEYKAIFVHKTYTHYEGNTFLKLIASNDFDNTFVLYGNNYHNAVLDSGTYPQNDKEVLLPKFMSEKYNINDVILLNDNPYIREVKSYYDDKVYEEELVKSLCGFAEGENISILKSQENLVEYKVVGFYSFDAIDDMKYAYDLRNVSTLSLEVPVLTQSTLFENNDIVDYVTEIEYRKFDETKYSDDSFKFDTFQRVLTNDVSDSTCNGKIKFYKFN